MNVNQQISKEKSSYKHSVAEFKKDVPCDGPEAQRGSSPERTQSGLSSDTFTIDDYHPPLAPDEDNKIEEKSFIPDNIRKMSYPLHSLICTMPQNIAAIEECVKNPLIDVNQSVLFYQDGQPVTPLQLAMEKYIAANKVDRGDYLRICILLLQHGAKVSTQLLCDSIIDVNNHWKNRGKNGVTEKNTH